MIRFQNPVLRAALAAWITCAAPSLAHAAVAVALTPAVQNNVAPNSDIDVFVDVTNVSSLFNGFDLVVQYDPTALTLVPYAPTTLQQGCLMTGTCSAACGNTFHQFTAAADSAVAHNVLLCNATTVQGPGRIYRLRFHTANVTRVTNVSIRRAQFFDAGLFVPGTTTTGAQIGIGVNVGVGDGPSGAALRLHAEPNPAFGPVALVSEAPEAGMLELAISDLQGRLVHHRAAQWSAARARLTWDGRDANGRRVPAGIYLARVTRAGRTQTTRIVRLP